MDYFDALEHVSTAGYEPLTLKSLQDHITQAPLSPLHQNFILQLQQDTIGEKYQDNQDISSTDVAEFNGHVQTYLNMVAVGAENIQYHASQKMDSTPAQNELFSKENPHQPFKNEERLPHVLNVINQTAVGQKALHDLKAADVPIKMDKLAPKVGGLYQSQLQINVATGHWAHTDKTLHLSETESTGGLFGNFLHEKRHFDQTEKKLIMMPVYGSPRDAILWTRIIEADAQAEAVVEQIAAYKEMRAEGNTPCLAMYPVYEAMYKAAADQLKKDPNALENGKAKRAAFDKWFETDVKDAYDAQTIKDKWPSIKNAFGKVSGPVMAHDVARSEFEKIGTVEGEKINYLTLKGFRTIDDEYYKGGLNSTNQKQVDALHKTWGATKKTPFAWFKKIGLG